MANDAALDAASLRTWVGRTRTTSDSITPGLVQRLLATLDREPLLLPAGATVPVLVHWCLGPDAMPMSGLGPDGHPARGDFLPPVPLPRRMWAGGALSYRDTLCVGDTVQRTSRIADVTVKEGRSGPLCFIAVEHELSTARGPAILERQDIVYRGIEPSAQPAVPPPPAPPLPSPDVQREVPTDPVLLFRYSALTFNAHRIHYDRRYCIEEENYPGLVVHGPLQATILMDLAVTAQEGRTPRQFDFRSVSPLFEGPPLRASASRLDDTMRLRITDSEGQTTMTATATW